MPSFEVAENWGFPDQLDGVIVPDDGQKLRFNEQSAFWDSFNHPLIALFVSERTTSHEIPFLMANDKVCGAVTFGIHRNFYRLGRTHLETVATEAGMPLLKLIKPPEYPDVEKNGLDKFIEEWLVNNPLKKLYHQYVSINLSNNIATIAPKFDLHDGIAD